MRSARTSLAQGRPLRVLVLAMLLLDSLGEDFMFHPEWGFDAYEITIPKKLSVRGRAQGASKLVAYLLQVKGKKHVLHLWPKRFLLPRHLQVFSFTEQGQHLEDYPYIPRDCNYVGAVEGSGDSEATVSTCMGGLRGILRIDAKHYQIEPLKASSTFEHVVYFLKDEGLHQPLCGLTKDEIEQQGAPYAGSARLGDLTGIIRHQRYFELALIFDHERYLYSNSNVSEVTNDAILLTSIMDTYFQELHLRIQLGTVEVWTDQDRVDIVFPTLQQALGQFMIYQRNVLSRQLSADWVQLYVKRDYIDALAWSWGRVCVKEYAGSISVFPDMSVLGPATWGTHNLGHSVGMIHDGPYCRCKGRRSCIMGTGRTGFSNCSYIQFLSHVRRHADCLNDIPGHSYVVKRCGNKIVEDDEQCDCGSLEDCEADQCCEPGCKFRHGVNCSTGLCCHNCHFRPSGYLCRKEENECDLAEYCDGTSGLCPNDTYKQDGTPCKHEALCFSKGCRSAYMQCQHIFGPDAREAAQQCYDAVNLIGDQHGNCGILGSSSYKKCTKRHTLCGRVQCINVDTLPDMPDYTTIVSTHLRDENLLCWGVGYHTSLVPLGIPDVGVVHDGTFCGEDRICVNRTCISTSILKFDCEPEKCNRRGTCNNNRNCHCAYGWAPPFCEEMGYGGSIDSGPPGPRPPEVPASARVVPLVLGRLLLLALSMVVIGIFRQLIGSQVKPQQKETPPPAGIVGEQPIADKQPIVGEQPIVDKQPTVGEQPKQRKLIKMKKIIKKSLAPPKQKGKR